MAAVVPAADPVVAPAEVMIELMTQMSRQLSALNIQQATTKKQNALLLFKLGQASHQQGLGKIA